MLGSWGGRGRRVGWLAAFDLAMWVRAPLVGAIGVVSMALLACAIALVRDTTGHDWYAAGKLTVTEILIEIGFDDRAPTEDGVVVTLTRDDLKYNGEALLARDHLPRTTADAAELGTWCGFGGTLLWLALIRRRERDYPIRRATLEPDPVRRIEARERFAMPSARPGFVASPSASAVPVGALEEQPPVSDTHGRVKPGSAVERRGEANAGRAGAPVPPAPTRHKRRKRTHGRGI